MRGFGLAFRGPVTRGARRHVTKPVGTVLAAHSVAPTPPAPGLVWSRAAIPAPEVLVGMHTFPGMLPAAVE